MYVCVVSQYSLYDLRWFMENVCLRFLFYDFYFFYGLKETARVKPHSLI